VLSNSLDVLRLGARKRAEVLAKLKSMEKELIEKLAVENFRGAARVRAAKFLKNAAAIIRENYQGVQLLLDLEGIGRTISQITAASVKVVLGADALKLPLQDYFASLASNVMIEGAPSKLWWAQQEARTRIRFEGAVRQGLASAETNQQIISRIVGKNGVPGVLEIERKHAATLVQTSVQAVANDARLATFRKNADVISAVKQVSTLDSHTSDVCIAYSGAQWDLDGNPLTVNGKLSPAFNGGPPRHFNCRSVLVPVTKTFKELGLNIPEKAPTQRASNEGPIDAKTTFDEFLKRKGKAYQDAQLGEGRADLWRAGKITLRDLVAGDGRPLTLRELRRNAGLD